MLRNGYLTALFLPAVACFAIGSSACVVEDHHHDDWDDEWSNPPPPSSGGNDGGGTVTTPILAKIDTGQTLNANPGEGVGIYSEYTAGGHWYIWWTCDTNRDPTHRPCDMAVDVHVETGKLANLRADRPLAGDTLTADSNGTDAGAHTTTTTNVTGILFDTNPGAILSLTAYVDGISEPAYFFFVQNGQVNGGYQGRLSNPLRLQGSTP